MLQTSLDYKKVISSNDRQFKLKIVVNGVQEIDGNYIKQIQITEEGCSNDSLTMGDFCSNSIKLEMFNTPTPLLLENGYIIVYSGLVHEEVEWVLMGTYYITVVTSSDNYKTLQIEGYDATHLLDKEYIPTIQFDENTTLQQVVIDISNVTQVSLETTMYPEVYIDGYLEGITCKEMLRYMAGLLGKNVKINRHNQISFYWYEDSNVLVERNMQYQKGWKRTSESNMVINSLTSGTENNVLISGSGYGISFMNPYMTQERLDSICEQIQGFTYTPCELLWRGNPAIEIGDILTVEEEKGVCTVVNNYNVLTLSGGLNSQITCKGETEKETVISKSPSEIKLNKLYHTLTNAFNESTETILGHNGGYYHVDIDETTGHPTGWTIMNTPTLEDHTCLWKWTSGGFGYSEDGGKTFTNIAIDMEGRISANVITTGILQGENFSLDLMEGSIIVGRRNDDGEFDDIWFKVDTTGLHMNTVEEIQTELSDMSSTLNTMNTSLAIEQGKIEQIVRDTTVIINGEEKTSKEAYSYMKQQIDAIHFAISESGGNNKLLNSTGWNATNFWQHTGSVKGVSNTDIRDNTISGYAFEMGKATLKQSFKAIIGNSYSLSCKIKKQNNVCSFKVINGNEEIYLFQLPSEYMDTWVSFNVPVTSNTTEVRIEIESDGNSLLISDIMANDGEIAQQWSSSNNEIYTTNVKIDKTGITVAHDDSDNKTVINTVEFSGYDGTNRVFSLNGDTTEVNRLYAKSDVQIGVVRGYAKTEGSKTGLGFAYIKK